MLYLTIYKKYLFKIITKLNCKIYKFYFAKNILLYVFLSTFIDSKIYALEISVFDCGQGNTVVASYDMQTMILDAGSKARKKFVRFQESLDDESDISTVFNVTEKPKNCDWFVIGDPETFDVVGKEMVDKENQWFWECFSRKVFGGTITDFEGEEGIQIPDRTLKGVFISHPDTDHYSLLKRLIGEYWITTEPVPFLLGGQRQTYTSLEETIRKNIRDTQKRPKIYCDHAQKASYFRENVPSFEAVPLGAPVPIINILTVNAIEQKAKTRNRNLDSMIVKISMNNFSFLMPGDAEEETWSSVKKINGVDPLQSDVLLISHHGSCTNGSTTLDLLQKRIKPKICLISAGFQHRHPDKGTLKIIKKYFSKTNYRVNLHFVTYYTSGELSSVVTDLPIFTTMDNGQLTLKFEQSGLTLETQRNFLPIPGLIFDTNSHAQWDHKEPPIIKTNIPKNFINIGGNVFSDKKRTQYYYKYREDLYFEIEINDSSNESESNYSSDEPDSNSNSS